MHGGYIFTDKNGLGYTRCTSNGGITFDSVYPSGIPGGLNAICFSDRQHATVVGTAGYIGHSTDGGLHWVSQISNTLNTLNAVAFGTVKAGSTVGYRGNIMRITTNEFLGVPQQAASGSPKPILDPFYPNPAMTATNVSYYLPSGGSVSMKIYSIDGKELAALANGFMQQGEHKARFDVSSLASGSYLLRLEFAGMSISERFTVLH
ncbi:MAG: T9SS type A sorting domain-containing protein [Candidatus Kapaibacterium sp.]